MKIGEGMKFQRIRRITGYLVGDKETRFNDAKKAEERDRVKHSLVKDAPLPMALTSQKPAVFLEVNKHE